MFGVMSWSGKARDLRQDPRCVPHSAISGPDAGEAELKLSGLAAPAAKPLREACPGAWWSSEPGRLPTSSSWTSRKPYLSSETWSAGGWPAHWSPGRGPWQQARPYP